MTDQNSEAKPTTSQPTPPTDTVKTEEKNTVPEAPKIEPVKEVVAAPVAPTSPVPTLEVPKIEPVKDVVAAPVTPVPVSQAIEVPKTEPVKAVVTEAPKIEAAKDDIDDAEEDELDEIDDANPIEAYCVKCKAKVEMEHPEAVWTSKGTPGTRGSCPNCGTTVFRMGKTPAHDALIRPAAVKVEGSTKIATSGGRKRAQPATYINFATNDKEFAKKLATDLENAGVHTWIESGENAAENVKWAGGVHPALKDSARMVVVLSPGAKDDAELAKAWNFFKTQKKPIVLALTSTVEVPDPLRRNPRFDFSADYKAALRQLMSALTE